MKVKNILLGAMIITASHATFAADEARNLQTTSDSQTMDQMNNNNAHSTGADVYKDPKSKKKGLYTEESDGTHLGTNIYDKDAKGYEDSDKTRTKNNKKGL